MRIQRFDYSCRCGCGLNTIDPKAIEIFWDYVEYFEEVYQRRLTPFVNRACSCVIHNEVIQKEANENYVPFSSRSKHMPNENGICLAIDGGIEEVPPYQIYKYLDEMYPDTIGFFKYFWGIHYDVRGYKVRW